MRYTIVCASHSGSQGLRFAHHVRTSRQSPRCVVESRRVRAPHNTYATDTGTATGTYRYRHTGTDTTYMTHNINAASMFTTRISTSADANSVIETSFDNFASGSHAWIGQV